MTEKCIIHGPDECEVEAISFSIKISGKYDFFEIVVFSNGIIYWCTVLLLPNLTCKQNGLTFDTKGLLGDGMR